MSHAMAYPVPKEISEKALITKSQYEKMYRQSIEDPATFWREQAQCIDWIKPFTTVKNTSFDLKDFRIKWFEEGTLNASVNCLDRHLETRGNQIALLWEGNDPKESQRLTYRDLYEQVCAFGNVLKSLGVVKGDRVVIYLPMIPEAVVTMLACARIGAIHSVVFAGFSSKALAGRLLNCKAKLVITADEGVRGSKFVPLKQNVDEALEDPEVQTVEHVVVVKRTGGSISFQKGRDLWYGDLMVDASTTCPPEEMGAEDPLFILYTSGSTGKPKGVLHTTGGYMVYAALTHRYIFDLQEGDIYWCSADVGWITGHTYLVYGPLANGTTSVMFEGIPTYPDASRFWQIIDRYGVSIFYTAPTGIRALMREGNDFVEQTKRTSLRVLGTVGEPINPEAWEWYFHIVGNSKCPIVDTWWQTETGGIMITPLVGTMDLKPGSALRPFFGVKPEILNSKGEVLEGVAEGRLVITDSWPGQMRTVFNHHERFIDTYFKTFEGYYTTGDGARRDKDGDYWITGRVDDVINVSAHRLGTAEIESALDAHPKVVESAAVGFAHDLKGEGIYAYVTLNKGEKPSDTLKKELQAWVAQDIGPIAKPDKIQWAPALPKTRSGKIMRRILRKIAANKLDDLGDTSTLADPSVVDDLIKGR